jgi:hypothetical protein
MSSSFKYLDNAKSNSSFGDQEDVAQEFLNEKLSKNRFTQTQQADLDAYGGSTEDPDLFNVTNNQKEIDAITAKNKQASLENGKLTAEQIREKFGFEYNEAHSNKGGGFSEYGGRDDGAIYNSKTGEYIGTIPGFSPHEQRSGKDKPAEGIDPFKAVQDYELEKGIRSDPRSNWNTMNDVAGAVNNIVGEAAEQETVPEFKETKTKIEYSPEIQQAKDRVRTYENDVLSGKVSDDVYAGNPSDKYNLDLNKGADGIGAFIPNTSEQATASFLDNKKSQIKDKYQFKRA